MGTSVMHPSETANCQLDATCHSSGCERGCHPEGAVLFQPDPLEPTPEEPCDLLLVEGSPTGLAADRPGLWVDLNLAPLRRLGQLGLTAPTGRSEQAGWAFML